MEKKEETYGHAHFFSSEEQSDENDKVLDSELLIHKAFEYDFSAGIETLFRWYYGPLCSHAVRYVSSKEIAEDIVSDVFCKLYLEKTVSHIKTSFRAYLFTWVRNRAFNYVKMEMGRNASIEYASALSIHQGEQPDDITQFEDLYHDIEQVINAMPQRRRKIYVMHRMEGKKYAEISGELDISVKTVKEHMYQATQQIREFLRKKWFPAMSAFLASVETLWNQI
ncbi:RNA polymerase sigma-70 factor [Dyadobacter sp. 676]|uniref:RNA polymerase sigma-70 factor n=1 Tax=Dyadobacter sp. 676 TaxID=3088362 RepID=A0AAU8FJ64_9BACT